MPHWLDGEELYSNCDGSTRIIFNDEKVARMTNASHFSKQLRQPQFAMFRNHNLMALSIMPIKHSQHFMHIRVRIDTQAAVVDN
jgi:hypothetical protein